MNTSWANKTLEEKAEFNRLRREKYAQNSEHRTSINARNKEWAKSNRNKINTRLKAVPRRLEKYALKANYDMTLEQYDSLLQKQDNKCACCGTADPGTKHKRFAVDHIHGTKIIRGLLCNSCNLGIGQLGDNLEGVLKAVEYLKRTNA